MHISVSKPFPKRSNPEKLIYYQGLVNALASTGRSEQDAPATDVHHFDLPRSRAVTGDGGS